MSVAVKPPRVDWSEVVDQAAGIVSSYSTGVTLRQLFYRLVAAEVLPNTTSAYKSLSSKTAEARREYGFPSLVDRTRSIHQLWYSEDPAEALEDMASRYRLDRTEGQDVAVYIGVKKNGIVNQLERWFQRLGIPIIALGGYASQTYRRAAATAPTWSCGGSTAASTKRRSGRSPRPAKANATESPPSPPGSWGRSAASRCTTTPASGSTATRARAGAGSGTRPVTSTEPTWSATRCVTSPPGLKLAEVSPRMVADYIGWLTRQPTRNGGTLADASVRTAVKPLAAYMGTARREGPIRHNPCAEAVLPHRARIEEDEERARPFPAGVWSWWSSLSTRGTG